ncbi:MAG: hypothetical protein ACFE8N_08690 [Promethearchaeota archaeon]
MSDKFINNIRYLFYIEQFDIELSIIKIEENAMDTILFYFETDDFRYLKLKIPQNNKQEKEKINTETIHKGGNMIWKK